MSEDAETHKKKKRIPKILLIIVAIIIGISVLLVAYQAYMYANPLARINFTTFAPRDQKIENSQLYIRTHYIGSGEGRQDTFVFPEVALHYQLDGMMVELRRDTGFSYECDANSYVEECIIKETSEGQKYRYLFDQQSSREIVAFSKDGTKFNVVSSDTKRIHTDKEWDHFIDSLQPTKFEHIEVRRVSHGI